MIDKFPDYITHDTHAETLSYEKTSSPAERVDALLEAYSKTLVNGNKAAYKSLATKYPEEELEHVRADQVDFACWNLAQSSETLNQAILLRSMQIVHEVDRFIASGQKDDFMSLYPLHTYENGFWQGVDFQVGALLSELKAVRAAELGQDTDPGSVHLELVDTGYLQFGDYTVLRRPTRCPSGEVAFVDYVVGHNELFEK